MNFSDIHHTPTTIDTKAPKSLLIYYGYPIAYNGIWDIPKVIDAIASKYDIWIVGDTYQDPEHESYDDTVVIIAGLQARGVEIYGYIPLGVNTDNRSEETLKDQIDQWKTANATGIFVDEFGFDYEVTRERQISIVDHIHGKGMNYIANAWVWENFSIDVEADLPEYWADDDWRRKLHQDYNPDDLPLNRNKNDGYLIENFCTDHSGVLDKFASMERIKLICDSNPQKLQLHAVAVYPETNAGSGIINWSLFEGFQNIKQISEYIWMHGFIFGLDSVGGNTYSFGSGGNPIDTPVMRLPDTLKGAKILGEVRQNLTTSTNEVTLDNGAILRVVGDTVTKNYSWEIIEKYSSFDKSRNILTNNSIPTIPTIADLRTMEITPDKVYVSGYHIKDDGAFGEHFFKKVESGVDNGGTIIVTDVGVIYELQFNGAVNIKWFGAKGDGVVDDTNVIQAIIDKDIKQIYIPTGVYIIDKLTIDEKPNISIYGDTIELYDNEGNTSVYSASTLKSASTDVILDFVNSKSFNITGLNIEPESNAVSCIRIGGSPLATLDSISINGTFNIGFEYIDEGNFNTTTKDCIVAGSVCYDSIWKVTKGANNLKFINCYSGSVYPPNEDTLTYGIYVLDNSNLLIEHCTIQGPSIGIWLGVTTSAHIVNFYTENVILPIMFGDSERVNYNTKVENTTLKMAYSSHIQFDQSFTGIYVRRCRGLSINNTDNHSLSGDDGWSFLNIVDGNISSMHSNIAQGTGSKNQDFIATDLITCPDSMSGASVEGVFYSDTAKEYKYSITKKTGEYEKSHYKITRDATGAEVFTQFDIFVQEATALFVD